ncbi:hypothetical protein SFRURICE_013523 [Spodoptera frugiperda]|nr:hypothetical protein SFRURICE_013523 [Spodoptera frugiperda]
MSGGKVLVIGSGGREHALCWKLADSPFVQQVYCAPGSVGIATTNKVECVELDIKDYPAIAQWCKEHEIDIVVVGPEDPLANGIVDNLTPLGIKCFGPTKAGARIEADKDWSKSFMNKYQIPTARHKSFTDAAAAKEFINTAPYPALVVKASGLAAGKGVVVAANKEEACQAVDEILTDAKYGAAGQVVVIEELLEGDEVSILAFTDGETVSMMPPAQDHKRVGDGDTGPNTGGMGAYCPCPLITPDQLLDVKEQVLQRAVDGLKAEGIKYVGVLYAGMMVTKSGPMTLEFNCRFGDPETQVLMTLLETDLYKIFKACVEGTLRQIQVTWNTKLSAVGVVIASKGYPETSTKGCVISGLTQVQCTPGLVVFHSGVARGANGSLVTWGGRVLLVCARAGSLRAAAAAATAAAGQVDFPGAHYRKDIAHRAFSNMYASDKERKYNRLTPYNSLPRINGLSYLQSGVDIDAAATLVRQIEPIATATHRRGVLGRLGCYSGLFQLSAMDPSLKDPVLVQGTDGVGTKLKIAEMMQKYDTLGQDLVAMCVNDILCAGAEPFAFLDYMACGRLQVDVATTIVKGIADACTLSGCALLGGETAEMPSMYEIGKYDLAGFAVGVVDNLKQLPRTKEIRPGDVVLALPSTGVHSNGYSLVQKIMMETGHRYNEPAAFSTTNKSYGEEFLVPTGIYVKALLPAIKKQLIKGLAHITGGGLLENIPRILPPGIKVKLDATKFNIKPVFGWLQAKGVVSDFEMLRTFNCGVGMVVIVDPVCVKELLDSVDEEIAVVGVVEAMGKEGGHQVVVENFKEAMHPLTSPYVAGDRASPQKSLSYKDSGVDIEAGDSLVSLIKPLARSTSRSGVLGGLGGFGGCFQLKAVEEEYKDPVLVLAADGVGTKLKIAQKINQHSTIGIDLVAMCVNDILCNGAAPLTFLDYFACGSLDVNVARNVVSGVAEGCRQSSAALIGGETAEMPGMYEPGVYDIAGFALGVVERSHILPKINDIAVGDIIIGLPSNGVHSNGFSLIHKLMKKSGLTLNDKAPFSKEGLTLGEELIKPTRIYVRSVLPALRSGRVKAVAHITGGGLLENIPRVIPPAVRARLNAHWWHVHPVRIHYYSTPLYHTARRTGPPQRALVARAPRTYTLLQYSIIPYRPPYGRDSTRTGGTCTPYVYITTVLHYTIPPRPQYGPASTRTGGTCTPYVYITTVLHYTIPPAVRARLNAHWWHVHPVRIHYYSTPLYHTARSTRPPQRALVARAPRTYYLLKYSLFVFSWIADAGAVQDEEMLRTFNCGIGMVLVVSPEDQAEVMNTTRAFGAMVIGSIQKRPAGGARVVVDNFASAMDFTRRMPLLPKKKALLDTTREAAQCMCADICLVVSNKKDAYALQRAEKAGVPALVFNHKDYASREEFDRAVSEALEAHKVDIVCLAGYMRILSSEFVKKWHGRLLNIHPSLLPRHPGLHAQRQCLDAGDRESGCTVHFVDEGMDTGPIILQERVPVLQKDTVESLTERIHEAEHRAYPRALRLVATGRSRHCAIYLCKIIVCANTMAFTAEEVARRYPIHWLVWNNHHEELKAHLDGNKFTQEELESKDCRGRTPLLLAVTLGHLETTRVLIEAGADVNCEKDGWTAVQEATSTGNPELLSMVLSRRDYQRHVLRSGGIPDLLRRLSLAPDFYVEMKWEFTSWGRTASLMELDHELGTSWCEYLEPMSGDREWPAPPPHVIDQRLAAPLAINYLDTDKISFERNKSGIWGWRQDKTENVNGYECKVFGANNVELVSKTRTEHVKGAGPGGARPAHSAPRAPLAGLLALADPDAHSPLLPEKDESPSPRSSRSREDLSYIPVTWQEYFSDAELDRDIGRPREVATKVQKFKATLWLCEDYPLEVSKKETHTYIIWISDMISTLKIPLFHVLNARITFGNIFATETPVPYIECIQEGDRLSCVVDDQCFAVGRGYRDSAGPDDRLACGVDDEEGLLQYAIQQSLMETGTQDDQVDVWEALRGARPASPGRPRTLEHDTHLLAHEERQLQRAIEASLASVSLTSPTSPEAPIVEDELDLDTDGDAELAAALALSAREQASRDMQLAAEQRAFDEALRLSLLDKSQFDKSMYEASNQNKTYA